MKKYLIYAIITAVLACHAAVFAQDEAAPPKNAKAKAEGKAQAKSPMFAGEITELDAAAATLTVKDAKDQTKSFKCADGCKVATAEKKKDATIADLKVGDKVRIQYIEQEGNLMAKKIGPAKPAKEPETHKKPKNQAAE